MLDEQRTFTDRTADKRGPDGGGYGLPKPFHDAELSEVGPGTPCGEFMRRYWQPVGVSNRVGTTPQQVRVLGEDLILFRDGQGRAGLLHSRCAHRGTSLYYGRVDDAGIRCCYHGWKFDVQGRCVDQPCEPGGGANKDRVRQPWYPVEELYGLVFAYMGPPQRRPLLPRYDILENLGADEKVWASGPSGFGAGADDSIKIVPCNWLQQYENTADPFHLTILHTRHSGTQFVPDLGAMPKVKFEYTDLGVRYVATFERLDGVVVDRVAPAMLPNVRSAPNVQLEVGASSSIVWSVPVDDTHHFIFQALKVPASFDGIANNHRATRPSRYTDDDLDRTPTKPKLWSELTEAERQRYPSDWEAQISQGPITYHSEEHLATSDIGVGMLRRVLRNQIRAVRDGGDPINVRFGDADACVQVGAGNFLTPSGAGEEGHDERRDAAVDTAASRSGGDGEMTLRLSANVSTLFPELPLLERIGAAARAGFEAVEMWFPYETPAADMAACLAAHKVRCVGINAPPGDVAKGDWGLAVDPARRDEFVQGVHAAMRYASAIDCPNVHVLAGNLPAAMQPDEGWRHYAQGIEMAAGIAHEHGRTVLVEPLNAIDRPAYLLTRQAQAIELIGQLQRPNVKIMLDLYHLQRGEGNLVERMRASLPHAGHVQVADVPGRHEPGTGEINFDFVFAELARLGYGGWIGCEYLPATSTADGLGWRARY